MKKEIDVTISGDRNVFKKKGKKILKGKDLIIETECTWNVKAKVVIAIARKTLVSHKLSDST